MLSEYYQTSGQVLYGEGGVVLIERHGLTTAMFLFEDRSVQLCLSSIPNADEETVRKLAAIPNLPQWAIERQEFVATGPLPAFVSIEGYPLPDGTVRKILVTADGTRIIGFKRLPAP